MWKWGPEQTDHRVDAAATLAAAWRGAVELQREMQRTADNSLRGLSHTRPPKRRWIAHDVGPGGRSVYNCENRVRERDIGHAAKRQRRQLSINVRTASDSLTLGVLLSHADAESLLAAVLQFIEPPDIARGWLTASRRLHAVASRFLDPARDDNAPIVWATFCGHVPSVRELLTRHGALVDPMAHGGVPLLQACRAGHVDTVGILLANPRVDPTIHGGLALRVACRAGHIDVVRLLLHDARVDPAAKDGEAVRIARAVGRPDIVNLLLLADAARRTACVCSDAIVTSLEMAHTDAIESARESSMLPVCVCRDVPVHAMAIEASRSGLHDSPHPGGDAVVEDVLVPPKYEPVVCLFD